MRKLRLELEELAVESFHPGGAPPGGGAGTVHGHDVARYPAQPAPAPVESDPTCGTCDKHWCNFPSILHDYTCYETCDNFCDFPSILHDYSCYEGDTCAVCWTKEC